MLNLNRLLTSIEDQKKRYRVLLNRSHYRSDLERILWRRSAGLLNMEQKSLNSAAYGVFVKDKQGVLEAFESVRQNIYTAPLHTETIMAWNAKMLRRTAPEIAGQFRSTRAHWLRSTMIFANWEKVPVLMDELVDGINKHHVAAFYWQERPDKQFQNVSHHPIINAIEANYNFISIHPFQDGNKRTARLVTSWFLGQKGYIPLCIYERQGYISSIESYAYTHRPHAFYGFLFDQMRQSYDDAINEAKSMEKVMVSIRRQNVKPMSSTLFQRHMQQKMK